MVDDHLILKKQYVWSASTLDHLTFDDTFEGTLQAFLSACSTKGLSPRTIEYYETDLSRFVSFCQAAKLKKPREVSPNHVRVYLAELRKFISAISVHSHFRAVRRYLHWLFLQGTIEINPMLRVEAPQRPKILISPFSRDDIETFLALCDRNTYHGCRDYALVLVFTDTGLRVSEMTAIELRDVNIKSRTIKVMGKGAKERQVKFCEKTLEAILAYHAMCGKKFGKDRDSHLWLNQNGEPFLTRFGIEQIIGRLKKRALIEDKRASPHIFRRTFAVMALDAGAAQDDVQRLLGHESPTMTQLYSEDGRTSKALRNYDKFSPVDNL